MCSLEKHCGLDDTSSESKAPYERRRTFLVEYIPGELWGLEQKLGLLYVHVPIRMTVLRLESGGLLVYGAVAPTDECLSLLRELESKYGAVRFLVLPTVAVEHKTFAGPLAQRLPDAEVWIAPGQYSVPLPLPLAFLGFPLFGVRELPRDSAGADLPWGKELEHTALASASSTPVADMAKGAFPHIEHTPTPMSSLSGLWPSGQGPLHRGLLRGSLLRAAFADAASHGLADLDPSGPTVGAEGRSAASALPCEGRSFGTGGNRREGTTARLATDRDLLPLLPIGCH